MQNLRGYTLTELMICLLIASIMLVSAAPSFSSLIKNNQKTQLTNQLVGLLHYARSTAVLKKQTVGICAGNAQCMNSLSWHGQLLAFNDTNGNGQLDATEELLRQEILPEGYSWHWSNFRSRYHLLYEHNGTTRALNGTFTLCQGSDALHQVVISLSGRARTQTPKANARCG